MRVLVVGLLILCLCPSLALAVPVTLDFSNGTVVSGIGAEVFQYTEAGINVTILGPPNANDNYFLLGGGYLHFIAVDGVGVVFSAANGGVFDLLSVQLLGGTQYFTSSAGAVLLTNSIGLITFPSDGWTGITSITMPHYISGVSMFESGPRLDSLTVNVHSVPEPSTGLLLGSGLLGLALWCRKPLA